MKRNNLAMIVGALYAASIPDFPPKPKEELKHKPGPWLRNRKHRNKPKRKKKRK